MAPLQSVPVDRLQRLTPPQELIKTARSKKRLFCFIQPRPHSALETSLYVFIPLLRPSCSPELLHHQAQLQSSAPSMRASEQAIERASECVHTGRSTPVISMEGAAFFSAFANRPSVGTQHVDKQTYIHRTNDLIHISPVCFTKSLSVVTFLQHFFLSLTFAAQWRWSHRAPEKTGQILFQT